jgi:imidazolonepropionase-like amidohydrolase
MRMNTKDQIPFRSGYLGLHRLLGMLFILLMAGCSQPSSITWEEVNEEGAFLIYRRQSPLGEEQYSITADKESIIVKSLQGENERGRITGVTAELHLDMDLSPTYYSNQRIANGDTTNIFKMEINAGTLTIWEKYFDPVQQEVPSDFFPLHSTIPAVVEMMLYHRYFKQGASNNIPTLPRGEVSMTHKGQDMVTVKGQEVLLDRYVVEGINWGGRTIWLDKEKNLVAIVKANTQIRELIRKGYEEALPVFVAGNVQEQMNQLADYTHNLKGDPSSTTLLTGATIVDGLSDIPQENMALLIKNGEIAAIEKLEELDLPKETRIIDVSGKTLIPGLWDMHAHSNQVQWAPAYLAGGVTTIRDNGNEIEFATAFRDAIDKDGMLGPDILLAGMTDGPGERGNGVIRATSAQQAREVVDLYFQKGYKQIKIYNSIQPDILPVLAAEAHKRGMTVTGHVPWAIDNSVRAIELGMDILSHDRVVFSILFPEKNSEELQELDFKEINSNRIDKAIAFLLEHNTALDPTINISVIRNLPRETPLKTIESGADRIAYELWEGKRFRRGVSAQRAEAAKERILQIMRIVGAFQKAGIPIVAGTDNIVPVFSLYQEIESYQKLADFTPLEAIQAATIVPARVMGMDSQTGTLEVGKEADIAILDENPLQDITNIRTVSAVVSNGNYYQSAPLWQAADFKPAK